MRGARPTGAMFTLAWLAAACGAGAGDDDSRGEDDAAAGDAGSFDGGSDHPPLCEYFAGPPDLAGGPELYGYYDEVPMVVVDYLPEGGLSLEEQLDCNPADEAKAHVVIDPPPEAIWIPSIGTQVLVTAGADYSGAYAVVRAPTGEVLWESGDVNYAGSFRIVPDPDATICLGEEPTSAECCCYRVLERKVALDTDDGEVQLGEGEQRLVTIAGRSYVAGAGYVYSVLEAPCWSDAQLGPRGTAFLVAAEPIDAPVVEHGAPCE